MKTIELQIVADSSKFVQSAKEVEQATTQMQEKSRRRHISEKGLIEDIIAEMKKWEDARKKAYRIEDIDKYNKKLSEAKQALKDYNQTGVETAKTQEVITKSTNNLWSAFKKLLLPILTITTLFKGLKAIFASTQQTGDFLKRELQGIKVAGDTLARAIATWNFEKLGERLKNARQAGKDYAQEMDAIGDLERQLQIEESRRAVKLAELAMIYRNTGLKGEEGYKKRAAAAEEYIEEATKGEEAAIRLINLRLEAELKLARTQAGLQDEYLTASEDRQTAIDNEIKQNLTLQSTFMQYEKELNGYQQLLKNIKSLGSIASKIDVKNAVDYYIATGKLTDQIKELQPRSQELIESNLKQIKELPVGIKEIGDRYLRWGLITDNVRQMITNSLTQIETRHAALTRGTIRANTMMELSNYQLAEEEKKINEDRTKQADKFSKELLQLWDEYSKKQIDSLTGLERIKAEEAYTIQLIDNEEEKLKKLGEIDEEGYKMLAALREFAHQKAMNAEIDYNKELAQQRYDMIRQSVSERQDINDMEMDLELQTLELSGKATEKARNEIMVRYYKRRLPLIEQLIREETDIIEKIRLQGEKEATENLIKETENQLKKKELNFWTLIGIDDPNKQQALEQAIGETVDNIAAMLDDLYARRVEDAERTRNLLDDQISETQRALEAEMDLMKAGYASNVDAKRKELEQLKKEREKAIKEEEKALAAQRKFETAMQAMSLITASANIIKSMTAAFPVVGLALAIPVIAAMWTLFAQTKAQAAKATQLEKGGVGDETGVITGRRHSQGGERFTDHIEVEKGEMWGVLSRPATRKYGKAFTEIVNNFNRDNLIIERPDTPINNVIVDVNQTNSRLDKVEYQLIRLNTFLQSQNTVQDLPNIRVEKRGNKTRIIRK